MSTLVIAETAISEEKQIIEQLNGSNIRFSSNDEKNEIMIQNLKSYIFQQNSQMSYIKLGDIIKNSKQDPEFTKISNFFDDVNNNTLVQNLSKYIPDEQISRMLKEYIDFLNRKIDSIPLDTITMKGGSKKKETKKGGSQKIDEILHSNQKDLNYYTIIGVDSDELITTDKFLIYFSFNFSNQTKNNETLKLLSQRFDELNTKSLEIIELCVNEIYTNELSTTQEKKDICEKYITQLNELYKVFNDSIQIEGNMYLFLYNPQGNKTKVVAGPYKSVLDYNFSKQNIISITSQDFKNINALNLYMRAHKDYVRKDEDTREYAETMSELEDIKNFDIMKSETFTTIISKLNNLKYDVSNYTSLWIIKDQEVPLSNEETSIYNLFTAIPFYSVKNGDIRDQEGPLSNIEWYSKKDSCSLTNFMNNIIENDKHNNYIIFREAILALQNGTETKIIKDKLQKIESNIDNLRDTINAKIQILDNYVETQKEQNDKVKAKVMTNVSLGTFVVIFFIIVFNYSLFSNYLTVKFVQLTAAYGFSNFVERWTGYNSGIDIKQFIGPIVIITLALATYMNTIYREFSWLIYSNLCKIPFVKSNLSFLVFKELDYKKYEAASNELSRVLLSNDPAQIKAITKKLLSNKPRDIIDSLSLKGGSRKNRKHNKKLIKTFKKYNKKMVKKIYTLKTKKSNTTSNTTSNKTTSNKTTRKNNTTGGGKDNFFMLEIINAISSIQYLFMFPEKFPIYGSSSVFNEIYKIILDIKIPVTNNVLQIN
jgi:hypothetical protein